MHCWSAAFAARSSSTFGETNEEFGSPNMEDPVLLVLQRASAASGPDVSPFRAIWAQWEAQGNPPGDRWIYLQAERALKQALAELGETNVVEFARSRDLERYAAALLGAIRRTERRGP